MPAILLFYLVNAVGVALLSPSGTVSSSWCLAPSSATSSYGAPSFTRSVSTKLILAVLLRVRCLTMQSCVGGVLGWPLLVRHLFPCASSRGRRVVSV